LRTIGQLAWLWAVLGGVGGCVSHSVWREPPLPHVGSLGHTSWHPRLIGTVCEGDNSSEIETLRAQYAATGESSLAAQLAELYCWLGVEAERLGSRSCTDFYYQAAVYGWLSLQDAATATDHRTEELYHTCLARVLVTAQEQGRYAAGDGLLICLPSGPVRIPLVTAGFAWSSADFQQVLPVGEYRTQLISRTHAWPGWGLPVVVRRAGPDGSTYSEEPFLRRQVPFAATLVLRPDAERWRGGSGDPSDDVLELYNPLVVRAVTSPQGVAQMAADISAPLAFAAITTEPEEHRLTSTLNPGQATDEGLFFLEPYQRGKIPVVFVHGLLSRPSTWLDMANDLRAIPGFDQSYQVWAFRYATGRSFLASAALLRRDLRIALTRVDPAGTDTALRQMVLVGHSMGGLVAKLQVTESGDELWRAVANVPLDQVVTDPRTRMELAEVFFFSPQPFVRRVLFLATPHDGSSWANRPVGRLGALLVEPQAEAVVEHQQLIADNPGVFSSEAQRRIPTSFDLLRPNSNLLQAIRRLPIPCSVHTHSIIGTGKRLLLEGPADGVVPVYSARYPGVDSELYVPATHTTIQRRPETIAEVARILCEHLAGFEQYAGVVAGG
jgi:pimeloyl-ACP methyl ester carboxylesterase